MRERHGHTFTYIAANMGIRRQCVWRLYQRAMQWVEPGEIRGGGRGRLTVMRSGPPVPGEWASRPLGGTKANAG